MNIFPKLTGKSSVGTSVKYLTDESRSETFSSDKQAKRQLIVQFWYPTKNETSKIPYAQEIIDEWKSGLSQNGFPEENIKELDEVYTYAEPNAKPLRAEAGYPVVLFSHGYVALRSAYTAYCEELASHGYIVVGIGHTYYTQIAKFPDENIYAAQENITQEKLAQEEDSKFEQKRWIEDVQFVLNRLEHLNKTSDAFFGLFDLQNVGMFGHSFGGSTALQMCRVDSRINAAVDLDGGIFGENDIEAIDKPIMFILGKESMSAYKEFTDQEIAEKTRFPVQIITTLRQKYYKDVPKLFDASKEAYMVIIDNANHAAFSDWALLKNLDLYRQNKQLFNLEQMTGSIDGILMTKIVNYFLVQFFNKYLKKENITLTVQPWMNNLVNLSSKMSK